MIGFCALLFAYAAAANQVSDQTSLSLLQLHADLEPAGGHGQQDLVFFHVPMNFGNSLALTAAVGSGSSLSYGQVSGAAKRGWDAVNSLAKPNSPIWGPLNPDLASASDMGYPWYYTPQRFWPTDLAEAYFGNKTVFGLLRDPYERIVALFRARGVARGWDYTPDGRVCADELNKWVKHQLTPLVQNPSKVPMVDLHVQADYFEGPYAITLPLDLDLFPQNANALLQEHGYNVTIQGNDMMHVIGCDDTWSGDLDDESKSLIKTYYARDFQLRCKHFGYCDDSVANHCLMHVPGMCPARLFTWNSASSTYLQV